MLPGDRAEFQFAAWRWTLVHPTGYPLYLILGGIWQHLLPLGDPAFRLNLFSAVWAAMAVALAYLGYRQATAQNAAAWVAALAFAFSSTLWFQATQAETYALNAFFVALLTLLALRWQATRRFEYIAAWSLAFGFGLTNHRTILLLLPGFILFFALALARPRDFSFRDLRDHGRSLASPTTMRQVAWCVLLMLLPLLLYLYVPLRASATPYLQLHVSPERTIVVLENTPSGWLSYLLGRTFQPLLAFDESSRQSLLLLPYRLLSELNPVGVALSLLGLAVLVYARGRSLIALTMLGCAAIVLFAVSYHIGSIGDYYIPVYFFFCLWMAVGLEAIQRSLRSLLKPANPWARPASLAVVLLILLLVPVYNLVSTYARHDRSGETEWLARWESILASNPPPNAILISNDRDEIMPLLYLQLVEGVRPDLLGLYPLVAPGPTYADTVGVIDSVLNSGRPVFFIKDLPDLGVRFRLAPAPGGIQTVSSLPVDLDAVARSDAKVGGQLKVVGYRVLSGQVRAGGSFTLAVYWQPLAPLSRDYRTSLQFFDRYGRKLAQGDDHRPGGDIYPSSLWRTGEILEDRFIVTMPPESKADVYYLYVRVYDDASDSSLGDLTAIGTIQGTE